MRPPSLRSARGLTAFLCVAATLACADATGPAEGTGVLGEFVASGGIPRYYHLNLPTGYDASRAWPLLIVYHGFGDAGAAFESRIGLARLTDSAGVIAVYPDGVQGGWAPDCDCTDNDEAGIDDVRFTRTLIRHLSDSLAVDPDRIVVAGFSQGGRMVHRLACDLAGDLAGAASVGALIPTGVADDCAPAGSMPMVFIHGTADAGFPWDGAPGILSADSSAGWWRARNGCGATPTVTALPDTANDGTSVEVRRYTGCAAGAVTLYRVEGGGHNWPGSPGPWGQSVMPVSREIDAGREILTAFGLLPAP